MFSFAVKKCFALSLLPLTTLSHSQFLRVSLSCRVRILSALNGERSFKVLITHLIRLLIAWLDLCWFWLIFTWHFPYDSFVQSSIMQLKLIYRFRSCSTHANLWIIYMRLSVWHVPWNCSSTIDERKKSIQITQLDVHQHHLFRFIGDGQRNVYLWIKRENKSFPMM